ncbi:MAG: hypothetical protein JW867_01480, partial [Candidatus Omnitrophica bacterium]|nr:hypothetical protein [Candidatus Omnitrophota bacterium]
SAYAQKGSLAAQSLYEEGLDYFRGGLHRLAEDSFRRCLAIDPGHRDAQKYLKIIEQSYVSSTLRNSQIQNSNYSQPVENLVESSPGLFQRNLDYQTSPQDYLTSEDYLSRQEMAERELRNKIKESNIRSDQIRVEAVNQARADFLEQKEKVEKVEKENKTRSRQEIIKQTLEDARIKIDTEYMFTAGEQSFEIINSNGGKLSKLTFPIEGGMGIVNAEAKVYPNVFISARYATSNFDKKTSKDEDWNYMSGSTYVNYQISEQDTKNRAEYWDANLYYRFLDLTKDDLGDYLSNLFIVDRLYLDVFGGYQQYKARHTMIAPATKFLLQMADGSWWTTDLSSYNRLNSQYEVTYKGPRIGLRVGGSITEKLSSNISMSYAWLQTKSHGCWNLRNFNWWHKGDGLGTGFTTDIEALYHFTPNFFLGAGFHYIYQKHKDLLYTGVGSGSDFHDLDQAREEKMVLYGPSLKLGYRW